MGLDQYAKKVKREYNHETLTETIVKTEIAYWRKHNALEGYMANLYRTKTADEGEFNCKTLTLDSDDLDTLEAVVKAGLLPETVGFFFGSCTKDNEEYKQNDLEFIAKARKCLARGYEVEYTSWW
tara:strand:- start:27 stop:401 length:375 start_codon:yes stop_codon:yes gene_type:complete